jgi:transketolase
LKARRQALVNKANELGGSELVNKWIDLHQIGDKKDQLIKMAKETGYS